MCQKLLNNFKLQIIIKASDAKWLKICSNKLSLWHKWLLCGEKKTEKKFRLQLAKHSHIFLLGGGRGKNSTFSKNILPCSHTDWHNDRHCLTYWLTHQQTQWLTDWQTLLDSLMDTLTDTLTDILTDTLTDTDRHWWTN